MRSVISITALSLHYLHLYKFWRYLGEYNYLSGSAHCTTSASSLCQYLHKRHHLRLFQRFRQKITSTRTLLNFLWYIRPCTPLQSSQFNHIQSLFDSDFFFSFEKCIFSVTKLRHSLMLPYLPHMFYSRFYFLVTLKCVFCAVHAYSLQVLSS